MGNGNGQTTTQVCARQTVVEDIPWRLIRPMPGQPREYFDQGALQELATSIRAKGQIIPAQVAPITDEDDPAHPFELIDGQRRWIAIQMAGVPTLRCLVVDEPDEDERYIRSVVANVGRESNHPLEIAVACDRIRRQVTMKEPRATNVNHRVASILGKSDSYVVNHLSLLHLHDDLKARMHPSRPKSERLPLAAAIMLARLQPGQQLDALTRIAEQNTSLLKATKRVLATIQVTKAPGSRGRPPGDRFRDMIRTYKRMAGDLEAHNTPQFAELAARRQLRDVQEMKDQLQRISDSSSALLDQLNKLRRS